MREIEEHSGLERGSIEYLEYSLVRNRLGGMILDETDPEKKAQIIKDLLGKSTDLVSARALASVLETDRSLTETKKLMDSWKHPNEAGVHITTRPVVIQGGSLPPKSPFETRTPTPRSPFETKSPRPTRPYIDYSGEIPREVNPMDPYYDRSGDFPTLIDPRKPGPDSSRAG